MEELELVNNLEKFCNKLDEMQKTFLESDIGKAVNSAIDIGLKAALPNLIEDQIIDIKNTILEQGFSERNKRSYKYRFKLWKECYRNYHRKF